MLSQIPEKLPNVIEGVRKSMPSQSRTAGDELADSKHIWILYNFASKDTKALLNVLFISLCHKSLEDLLEYSDEKKEDLKHVGQSGEPSTP